MGRCHAPAVTALGGQALILRALRLVPGRARAVQHGLHEGVPVHPIMAHAPWGTGKSFVWLHDNWPCYEKDADCISMSQGAAMRQAYM